MPNAATSAIPPLTVVDNTAAEKEKDKMGEYEDLVLHLDYQTSRCQSTRYHTEAFPRCTACIRRQAGDGCRFQDIRAFLRDLNGDLVAFTFPAHRKPEAPSLHFPTRWNVRLAEAHLRQTMLAVAKALLPTLRQELQHLTQPEVIQRSREVQVRTTCDTCMTSIFSSSWICRMCGRESCPDCFAQVKELTSLSSSSSPSSTSSPSSPSATLQQQQQQQQQKPANPHFLFCSLRTHHTTKDFSPMSRFCREELELAISEMDALLVAEEGEGAMDVDAGADAAAAKKCHTTDPTPSGAPEHVTEHFTHEALTDAVFQEIWARGEPLVVTGLLPKFEIEWTPEFFMQTYGAESCSIVECQTDVVKQVTVGEFFSLFGKYDGRRQCWKLKDWPPSADFKTTFPDLYRDFSNAVPVPNYVRRDGALNVSSHFPSNIIVPDLGPKMYNALRSEDGAGSQGTTRLHMDMADALNIMVHAEPMPDGTPGYAAWDLFHSEDSDKIRQFLRDKFRVKAASAAHAAAVAVLANGGGVNGAGGSAPVNGGNGNGGGGNGNGSGPPLQDPIHSQQYYLDSTMRMELYVTMGVMSHRVYQKPGEAVFIPAGCAHQVCNFSDCIKVASDFVSPQNIARCEKLTREFREQNQRTLWKEDVLQLRTMMWFAWLSCSRYLSGPKNGKDGKREVEMEGEGESEVDS